MLLFVILILFFGVILLSTRYYVSKLKWDEEKAHYHQKEEEWKEDRRVMMAEAQRRNRSNIALMRRILGDRRDLAREKRIRSSYLDFDHDLCSLDQIMTQLKPEGSTMIDSVSEFISALALEKGDSQIQLRNEDWHISAHRDTCIALGLVTQRLMQKGAQESKSPSLSVKLTQQDTGLYVEFERMAFGAQRETDEARGFGDREKRMIGTFDGQYGVHLEGQILSKDKFGLRLERTPTT